jgi:hypothetical protein
MLLKVVLVSRSPPKRTAADGSHGSMREPFAPATAATPSYGGITRASPARSGSSHAPPNGSIAAVPPLPPRIVRGIEYHPRCVG